MEESLERPKLKIFIVDDDPGARKVIAKLLEPLQCRLFEFATGRACLDAMIDAPHVILLDVELPDIDGIEVCRSIRETGQTDVQIIFISCHDDLETRVIAYVAGGNDYLIKPVEPAALIRKVQTAEQTLESRKDLELQVRDSRRMVFTALSSMEEMRMLVVFMRDTFQASSPEELSKAVFSVLRFSHLNGLLALRSEQAEHYFSPDGPCTPLESSILDYTRAMEHITHSRDRMVLNFPNLTLLITSLPVDDKTRLARLREHLEVIAEGVQVRWEAMLGENIRITQAQCVLESVGDLVGTLEEIDRLQVEQGEKTVEITRDYIEELEHRLIFLDLSAHQEQTLMSMARHAMIRVSNQQAYSQSVADRLGTVTNRLRALVQ